MKLFRSSRKLTLLLLMAALCFTAACRKKAPPPPENAEETEEPGSSEKITLSRPGEEKESRVSGSGGDAGGDKKSIPAFSGPLLLQQILPQSRILPDGDFCGPLLDFDSKDAAEREAASLIYNFFNSYRRGVIDKRFLVSDRNPLFNEELEMFKKPVQDMTDYICGSFTPSASDASVRIRLYSTKGSITGFLYLSQRDGKWLLEDWELPLADWDREETDS